MKVGNIVKVVEHDDLKGHHGILHSLAEQSEQGRNYWWVTFPNHQIGGLWAFAEESLKLAK